MLIPKLKRHIASRLPRNCQSCVFLLISVSLKNAHFLIYPSFQLILAESVSLRIITFWPQDTALRIFISSVGSILPQKSLNSTYEAWKAWSQLWSEFVLHGHAKNYKKNNFPHRPVRSYLALFQSFLDVLVHSFLQCLKGHGTNRQKHVVEITDVKFAPWGKKSVEFSASIIASC